MQKIHLFGVGLGKVAPGRRLYGLDINYGCGLAFNYRHRLLCNFQLLGDHNGLLFLLWRGGEDRGCYQFLRGLWLCFRLGNGLSLLLLFERIIGH